MLTKCAYYYVQVQNGNLCLPSPFTSLALAKVLALGKTALLYVTAATVVKNNDVTTMDNSTNHTLSYIQGVEAMFGRYIDLQMLDLITLFPNAAHIFINNNYSNL